ncbi:MAG: hypothetical protein ACK4KV_18345 [Rhodocyclaceae bacterium]
MAFSNGMTPDRSDPYAWRATPLAPEYSASAELDSARERLIALSLPAMESLYQQLASPTLTVLLADRLGCILSLVGARRTWVAPFTRHAGLQMAPPAGQPASDPGTPGLAPSAHPPPFPTTPFASAFDLPAAADIAPGLTPGLPPGTHPDSQPPVMEDAASGSATLTDPGFEQPIRGQILGVAAPILAPDHALLGIVDVAAPPGDSFSHANALLQTTAAIIEHRLIESDASGFLLLRFHARAGVLGSPLEALALFDRDSRLIVANRVAAHLLAPGGFDPDTRCPDCFDTQWTGLVGYAALSLNEPFVLRGHQGIQFFARASLR